MIKRALLMTALLSVNAMAQQNADISETDFSSGAANARLAALGREAAASGKQLVVTAPQHWHAKIAASIRGGGKADLVLQDGFYETVSVRVQDKKAEEPPKPEVKPVVAPAPVKAAPIAAPTPVKVAPVAPVSAPTPAPVSVERVVAPPPAAPVAAPVAVEPAVDEVEPESLPDAVDSSQHVAIDPAAFVGAEPGDVDPVREAMEKQYNEGRRVTERVVSKTLRNGDVIYVRNSAAIVVRREGRRLLRFWLEGPIDLTQTGISAEGSNKYRILKSSMR